MRSTGFALRACGSDRHSSRPTRNLGHNAALKKSGPLQPLLPHRRVNARSVPLVAPTKYYQMVQTSEGPTTPSVIKLTLSPRPPEKARGRGADGVSPGNADNNALASKPAFKIAERFITHRLATRPRQRFSGGPNGREKKGQENIQTLPEDNAVMARSQAQECGPAAARLPENR